MNEIEDRWKKLRLTEEEALNIELDDGVSEEVSFKEEVCLIGNVWIDRRVNKGVIESVMAKIWRINRRAKFHVVGPNTFVVELASESDKLRIMAGRPWLFDEHLFVLKEYDGCVPPHKMLFNTGRLWLQMFELPLNCMNKSKGEMVGGTIGRVIEVETGEDGRGWGISLRVQVEIDIQKPLARGRTINLKGRSYWIPLRYEKLPHFCFTCGCIVHDEMGCKGEKEGEAQFGVWLRAGSRPKYSDDWRSKEKTINNAMEGVCSGEGSDSTGRGGGTVREKGGEVGTEVEYVPATQEIEILNKKVSEKKGGAMDEGVSRLCEEVEGSEGIGFKKGIKQQKMDVLAGEGVSNDLPEVVRRRKGGGAGKEKQERLGGGVRIQ